MSYDCGEKRAFEDKYTAWVMEKDGGVGSFFSDDTMPLRR